MVRRTRLAAERGSTLVASLVILALLSAVMAATLLLTRSELWVAGSARAFQQARYSAEAGVWHALALLAPGTDFGALIAGSGGVSDPAAPGPLPLPGGGFAAFPGSPFGYVVTAHAAGFERVRLRSAATAVRGARRSVDATVGREAQPYAPAPLVVLGGGVEMAPALAGLAPEAGGVGLDARAPAGGSQAIVAAADIDAAELARATLAGAGATLRGGVPRGRARAFDLARFAQDAGLAAQVPAVLAATQGGAGAPVALLVTGGAAPRLAGHGVLFASGTLELAGEVAWRGALYVAGELRIVAAACRIDGLVWAESISFVTGCDLRLDPSALAEAEAALRLPRRPTLLALDDP